MACRRGEDMAVPGVRRPFLSSAARRVVPTVSLLIAPSRNRHRIYFDSGPNSRAA